MRQGREKVCSNASRQWAEAPASLARLHRAWQAMADPMDIELPAPATGSGAPPRALIACPRRVSPPDEPRLWAWGTCVQPSAELGARWPAVECPCIAFSSLSYRSRSVLTRGRLLITAESSAERPSPGEPAELAPSPLRSGLGAARGSLAAAGKALSGVLGRKRAVGENAAPQQPKPPQPLAPVGKASGAVMAKQAYAFTDHCGTYPCAAPPLARRLARSCYAARAPTMPRSRCTPPHVRYAAPRTETSSPLLRRARPPLPAAAALPSRALRRPSQRDLGRASCSWLGGVSVRRPHRQFCAA